MIQHPRLFVEDEQVQYLLILNKFSHVVYPIKYVIAVANETKVVQACYDLSFDLHSYFGNLCA